MTSVRWFPESDSGLGVGEEETSLETVLTWIVCGSSEEEQCERRWKEGRKGGKGGFSESQADWEREATVVTFSASYKRNCRSQWVEEGVFGEQGAPSWCPQLHGYGNSPRSSALVMCWVLPQDALITSLEWRWAKELFGETSAGLSGLLRHKNVNFKISLPSFYQDGHCLATKPTHFSPHVSVRNAPTDMPHYKHQCLQERAGRTIWGVLGNP